MNDIPRRLEQLEEKLHELAEGDCDPMSISQVDGYLAGIIVCPELIMPGEWLPGIWGTGGEDDAPVFESADQARKLMSLIMEHYNAIIADIGAQQYAPIYYTDTRNDEILWELWIDGFEQAMQLRPECWGASLGMDADATAALAGLIALADIANRESKLKKRDADELQQAAPDLIPAWVQTLNAFRITQHAHSWRPTPAPILGKKAGRNDPCPCGSGKKYKKCCGLN